MAEIIEMAMCNFGIEVTTKCVNDIFNSWCIHNDQLKSTFLAIPKKTGTLECEDRRTMSLMSHMTKLVLKIIMRRVRSKVKQKISDDQCGFTGYRKRPRTFIFLVHYYKEQ